MPDHHYYSNFIWDIADLLRGPYRPPQYERVMLPLTVLRRFDCVLADTKEKVLAQFKARKDSLKDEALDAILNKAAGQKFHNRSPLNFEKLKGDPDNIDKHLVSYIKGFSKNIQVIFDRFEFGAEIERMRESNILFLVVSKFCDVDLHPDKVDNIQMGLIFEDLIRRFNEQANETAGDYFTPREVIRLMVDILFDPDDDILTQPGVVRKLLDPACGTGGMLSEAQNHLRKHNQRADLWTFGQDFNPRAYAIAASDMLMKGNGNSDIRFGDSFTDDKYPHDDSTTGGRFDYFLANPPFGVDWKRQKSVLERERDKQGYAGRFGAGLPRVNDGSLLFLQHMISKFEPYDPSKKKYGSRLGIVFNGSPLFTGGAGSGESEIRKWVIENDWLEAIVALPEQMFYNTGIGTYIWIVSNRKQEHRKGRIQLIDARGQTEDDADKFWLPMRRSLGDKRRRIGGTEEGDPDQIGFIVNLYGNFVENRYSKIFDNEDFGYNRITIERPLRLLYQMNVDSKSNFLDAAPHLLDDVQAIDKELGREPRSDWTEFDQLLTELLKRRGSKWKAAEKKLFRDVFTERNIDAEPVVKDERKPAKEKDARVWGWFLNEKTKTEYIYEPDTQLRDAENVSKVKGKDDEELVKKHFWEEILPHVQESWVDRESRRSAYEINFNRYFYSYTPPRPLAKIDADIKNMEEEIVRLLREVTK